MNGQLRRRGLPAIPEPAAQQRQDRHGQAQTEYMRLLRIHLIAEAAHGVPLACRRVRRTVQGPECKINW
ncbi:hypothetical protein D3C80_2183600 [compost metagenome]